MKKYLTPWRKIDNNNWGRKVLGLENCYVVYRNKTGNYVSEIGEKVISHDIKVVKDAADKWFKKWDYILLTEEQVKQFEVLI